LTSIGIKLKLLLGIFVGFMAVVLKQNKMRRILILLILLISCSEKKEKNTSKIEGSGQAIQAEISKQIEEKAELELSKTFILGKFNYRKDTSFVKVDKSHSSKTIYLNKEV